MARASGILPARASSIAFACSALISTLGSTGAAAAAAAGFDDKVSETVFALVGLGDRLGHFLAADALLHRFDDPVTRRDAADRPLSLFVRLRSEYLGCGFTLSSLPAHPRRRPAARLHRRPCRSTATLHGSARMRRRRAVAPSISAVRIRNGFISTPIVSSHYGSASVNCS